MTPQERKAYKKEYREKNKEKHNAYNKEYYEKNKEKLKEYREKNKEKRKEWYEKNKERIRIIQKEYREKNKEIILSSKREYNEKNKEKLKEYREKNKEKLKEYREKNKEKLNASKKESNEKRKEIVYNHYSNGKLECSCCSEKTIEFLQLDHIYNNGNLHRRKVGSGSILYSWVIKNNFPPILQILCANCNFGKRMNDGICPHLEVRN